MRNLWPKWIIENINSSECQPDVKEFVRCHTSWVVLWYLLNIHISEITEIRERISYIPNMEIVVAAWYVTGNLVCYLHKKWTHMHNTGCKLDPGSWKSKLQYFFGSVRIRKTPNVGKFIRNYVSHIFSAHDWLYVTEISSIDDSLNSAKDES